MVERLLKRLWCEMNAYHPTVIWGTEWQFGAAEAVRVIESRCTDCGWVRWRRTETKPIAPPAPRPADGLGEN